MFPTMPAYYEVRGYANSLEGCPKEVWGTAHTREEAEELRREAEKAGWLVEIIYHPASHR